MNRRFTLVTLLLSALVVCAGFPGRTRADDQKTGETQPSAGQAQWIESRGEHAPPVPDFAKTYQLPFESLLTVGHRLSDARRKCDPITIALIATEIGVAEKVSGKKADLTSEKLVKEAVDLAKLRRREKELNAVALLVQDAAEAEQLRALATTAKAEEAERISIFKSGEREKGFRFLLVNNNAPDVITVTVNGVVVGDVMPFSPGRFFTPFVQRTPFVTLRADDYATGQWWFNTFQGGRPEVVWNISP